MGSLWPKIPVVLPQASSFAPAVDAVFAAISIITLVMTLLIFGLITFFAVRYRRGSRVNRELPAHEGITLELAWTIAPLIILLALFVWSTMVYFTLIRPPKDAMEVYVVGKQWMWKIKQPNGRWEMNELHLPVGRAVKLTMISEDVIHSFWVPAFRTKQDVIPGRYTSLWFEPTRVGQYHIFCSQFCGTNHAIMGGYVHVMEPADYERWLQTGSGSQSMAAAGEKLFREHGCTGCHGGSSSVKAPTLEGIYNRPVAVELPGSGNKAVVIDADNRYIHDSILLPEKEIAAGFEPIMPSFKGKLTEEEVVQLIDYIRSLGATNGTSNNMGHSYNTNDKYIKDVAKAYSGSVPSTSKHDMANPASRDRVLSGESARTGGGKPDMANPVSRDLILQQRSLHGANERMNQ